MKIRRSILALGAFFVLSAGITACGSGVPGNSVADVAGNPITTQAFNHWMYVAAKGNAAQSGPGSPVVVPTDPPNFKGCIAQARKLVSAVAKQKDSQVRSECKNLFNSLSSQVMDFLIRAYWYQADAAKQHITVTPAQVQQRFQAERLAQFPSQAQFQAFLSAYGYTMDDLLFRTRVQLLYNKLIQKQTKSVTTADINAYYAAHQSQFGSPETRNLRIVLTKTQSQAQAAKSALSSGQSWDAVAKRYSIDPATKSHGGALNNISKGQTDQALESAAFSTPVNKVVGPVKGQFGYYVIEVTKINGGTHKSLAQSTAVIRQTLSAQAQSNAQSKVDARAKKNWLSKTSCQSSYAMNDCRGYKAPKGSSTTAPTAPPTTTR
jgi:foldase protein PrsA